jgi:hypothetical protein
MSRLTRVQAYDAIEDCGDDLDALLDLAAHWGADDLAPWSDTAGLAESLCEFVDSSVLDGDHVRSYGPHDTDQTNLEAMP